MHQIQILGHDSPKSDPIRAKKRTSFPRKKKVKDAKNLSFRAQLPPETQKTLSGAEITPTMRENKGSFPSFTGFGRNISRSTLVEYHERGKSKRLT